MLAKKGKKRKVKKSGKKQFLPKFFGTIFILFAVYLLYTNVMIYIERSKIESNYKNLSSSVSQLNKEKEALKMQLGETYSDEYLERVAREELGLQKEGERIVVIKKAENSNDEAEESEEKKVGPLDELFKWISSILPQK
ncbi:septum formation initiator family protein [bacterium]|nr:septum formation initiator family protein [bacterium]